MRGYFKVNTFLRDFVFINEDIIKIYFHVTAYHGKSNEKIVENLYSAKCGMLKDESTRCYKKLIGTDWQDYKLSEAMNSYVISWRLYNSELHIYSKTYIEGMI